MPRRAQQITTGRQLVNLFAFAFVGALAYFYFGFSLWTAISVVLLAPIALLVGLIALLLVVWVVAAPFTFLLRFRRNREVRQVVTSTLSGASEERIILFLRQFEPLRGWTFSISSATTVGSVLDRDPGRFFLDSWADELSATGVRVVKVADRVDATVGGSLRLDDAAWRDEVMRLVAAADAILLLPGIGEGIFWEVAQIKEQRKVPLTTFVMPSGSTAEQAEVPLWESYRSEYRTLGFDLPSFSPDGMLMKFNSSGALAEAMPLVGSSVEELRTFILAGVTPGEADGALTARV